MSFTVIIIIVCVAVAAALVAVFLVFGRSEANFTFDIGGNGPKASGGSDSSAETTTQGRLVGQAAVSGGIIAVLLAKLWSMQLLSSDQYTQQAESNRTRTVSVPAPRGRILDRNGKEIVGNRSSLTVLAEADVADDDIELRLIGPTFRCGRRIAQGRGVPRRAPHGLPRSLGRPEDPALLPLRIARGTRRWIHGHRDL